MPAVCSEPSGWELTKDLMRSLFNPVSLDVKITAGKSSREVAFRPQFICIFCFKALNAPVTNVRVRPRLGRPSLPLRGHRGPGRSRLSGGRRRG